MNRKEFLRKSVGMGLGSGALLVLNQGNGTLQATATPEEELTKAKREKEFIEGWLTDLLDTMGEELDEKTIIKLIEGCGRGCYNRHQFKKDIAKEGANDLEKLLAAYRKVFGNVQKEGNAVHIRFNTKERGCFCPVLRERPSKINAMHCHCHKGTHEAIFKAALGRTYEAKIVESVRRGGERCHFVIELT
ncbi:MAG: hypothetical protein EHM61_11345 [Acidobacteria bacterium]|nr:MAG: hypothetical protein EHM61_11345 [Acidobacteriota bacterium]